MDSVKNHSNLKRITYFLIPLLPCFNCLQVIKFEFKSPDFEFVLPFHYQSHLMLSRSEHSWREDGDNSHSTQVTTKTYGYKQL